MARGAKSAGISLVMVPGVSLVPDDKPEPVGGLGPPLRYSPGERPNFDRDATGGITTRANYVPEPPEAVPPLQDGLSCRRQF